MRVESNNIYDKVWELSQIISQYAEEGMTLINSIIALQLLKSLNKAEHRIQEVGRRLLYCFIKCHFNCL